MSSDHAADAITGIDHTLVGVRDLEAARGAWETLGFTLTPRGRHIGWGTGNYCIMLESGYVELLGVVDPSQFLNNLDGFLKRREGLMGLAFGTDNPGECAEVMKQSGIVFEGPKGLKRKLEMPEGEVLPAFELLYLDREATPSLNAFITHHLTPGLIRRPEWLRHANRARRLISVTIVTEDPVRTVIGYLPLFGPERIQVSDAMTVVDTGGPGRSGGALRFVTPKALRTLYDALLPLPEHETPWVAAMKIEVADKARCRDFLKDRNVPVEKTGKGCLVPPEVANGCIIEFVQL
jgi:hypothetical protein